MCCCIAVGHEDRQCCHSHFRNHPHSKTFGKTTVKIFLQKIIRRYILKIPKNNDLEQIERTDDHGRSIDLQTNGRLSDTQSDFAGNEVNREIRNDEINLSQEQPQEPLLRTDDNRETDGASGGNGQDSERTDTDNSRENGENGGHNRSDESQRPAELDRTDEQSSAFGGGIVLPGVVFS